MRTKLNDSEIAERLKELPHWTFAEVEKLHREFQFADFVHAFGFMATSAIAIEKMNHHPEWSNVYNRVSIDLTTHDAGGVSERDFELARLLDSLAARTADEGSNPVFGGNGRSLVCADFPGRTAARPADPSRPSTNTSFPAPFWWSAMTARWSIERRTARAPWCPRPSR